MHEGPDRRSWIVGQGLGLIALLCVLNLWAAVTVEQILGMLGTAEGWAEGWGGSAVPLALYGAHAFGVPGAYLARTDRPLGVIAIVLVWLSFLVGLPFRYIFG